MVQTCQKIHFQAQWHHDVNTLGQVKYSRVPKMTQINILVLKKRFVLRMLCRHMIEERVACYLYLLLIFLLLVTTRGNPCLPLQSVQNKFNKIKQLMMNLRTWFFQQRDCWKQNFVSPWLVTGNSDPISCGSPCSRLDPSKATVF